MGASTILQEPGLPTHCLTLPVISAFINSKGQIINQIKSTESGVIEVKSFYETKKTLFSSFGNKIFFYFLIFYIILIFFLKKNRENN